MSLRVRKAIYLTLALVACVVWVPLSLVGIAFFVGAVGLLSIGALFRCILALPVTSSSSRWYFSVAISVGIVLMCYFTLYPFFSGEPRSSLLPVVSGLVLVVVGVAVLTEMYAKHA